jgi:hypothetical protein
MQDEVYKLRGVEWTVNSAGCLISSSDWETIYPARPNDAKRAHYGTNADLFQRGFGGRYFATAKFWEEIKRKYG